MRLDPHFSPLFVRPLHCVNFSRALPHLIQALVAAYPEATVRTGMTTNKKKCVPLHMAIRQGGGRGETGARIVELLVGPNQEAVRIRYEGKLPLELALDIGASPQILKTLLAADMPVDTAGRDRRPDYAYSWAVLLGSPAYAAKLDSPATKAEYIKIVTDLLDGEYKAHVSKLAYSTDADGRTVLQFVEAVIKRELERLAARSNKLLWPTPRGPWRAPRDCYVADAAGPWHALIGC